MDDPKSVSDDWGQFVYLDNSCSIPPNYYIPVRKFKNVKEFRKFRTLPTIHEKNESLNKSFIFKDDLHHYSINSSKIATGILFTVVLSLFVYKSCC